VIDGGEDGDGDNGAPPNLDKSWGKWSLEVKLGEEKAYVSLGNFIEHLMCIGGESRAAHTSHMPVDQKT
jgi:hypothetical protein